jgi:hypothetical protein
VAGINLHRLMALALSLAAHLFLIFSVGAQIVLVRTLQSGEKISDKILTIDLASHGANITAKDAPFVKVDKHEIKMSGSTTNFPASSQAASDIPPPIVNIMLPPEQYYFHSSELTEKPQVLFDISATLAASLSSEVAQSTVLRLRINEHGEIDEVIIDASDYSEEEKRSIIAAFEKIKFEPGKINNQPVKSELKIEVAVEKIEAKSYSK